MRKKIISAVAAVLLAAALASCGAAPLLPDTTEKENQTAKMTEGTGMTDTKAAVTSVETDEPLPSGLPDDITEQTDHVTETWVAVEISFETEKDYKDGEQLYVYMDAVFRNRNTGTELILPCFYNGGKAFAVRFAPPEYGVWEYRTVCETDASLDGKTGTAAANPYRGNLKIYRHGFVKTNGSKYFVYDDGVPFFYLGDTHWSLFTEETEKSGASGGRQGTKTPHFQYIVDKRVEQGFTVYQSEPIGLHAKLSDGSLSEADAEAFKKDDVYFRYIAEKGLVHANAEFFFSGEMNSKVMNDDRYLEALSRYWVARFGAYPVMWTLAQEADNDFYRERGDQKIYDYTNNPWVKIAEYIHKYDAYGHPLSCHQENTIYTTVTGKGVTQPDADNGGRSVFLSDEVSGRTGHDFYASQWQPDLKKQDNGLVPKDYYESKKVAIYYEGRYCNLWTKDYGARAQSWIAMLNGFAGVGYGAADIWLYNGTYNLDEPSDDGIETVSVADKAVKWKDAVEFESAYQQGYMKRFFERFEWWRLEPDFNDGKKFSSKLGSRGKCVYSAASIGSDLYVIYMYSKNKASGSVCDMEKGAVYTARWFNPRTGEYTDIGRVAADITDENGKPAWTAPERPEALDYVLILIKE